MLIKRTQESMIKNLIKSLWGLIYLHKKMTSTMEMFWPILKDAKAAGVSEEEITTPEEQMLPMR